MTKRKTIKALLLITVFVLSIIFTGCSAIQKTPEAISKEVVAKVGSQEIKKADFDKMFGPVKASYEQKYGPEIWNKEQEGKKVEVLVKESALDAMIDDTLQLKKAADMGDKQAITYSKMLIENDLPKMLADGASKFYDMLNKGSLTGSKSVGFERGQKIGVNDTCPCGSGKKYKRCCKT